MVNDLDIIHMNGRIYDPTLGRFLQADPNIQAPLNSQNYNRYAYVLNNPMSYTDPSGYFFKALWKGVKNAFRAIAKVPILNAALQVAACTVGGPPGCAAYAAISTYAVTGSLKAGIKAGVISYASGRALQGIGGDAYWGDAGSIQNIAANAVVGGITSDLQGGNFGHGFFAAGVASAFKPAINDLGGENSANSSIARGDVAGLEIYKVHRIIAASVVGGTASVISGGKFSNGAVTGAFTQMFNAETNNYK
jgi:RHS repeat-associated protein